MTDEVTPDSVAANVPEFILLWADKDEVDSLVYMYVWVSLAKYLCNVIQCLLTWWVSLPSTTLAVGSILGMHFTVSVMLC